MKSDFISRAAATVITLLVTVAVFAIPAMTRWHQARLADGSTVTVTMVGDEHGHWFIDREGKPLLQNADGTLYYPDSLQFDNVKTRRLQRFNASNIRRTQKLARKSSSAKGKQNAFGGRTTYAGRKKGIVILVNYADKAINASHTNSLYTEIFNTPNYTADNRFGSVHDYFYDQSYGMLDLSFDIVGPLTLSRPHTYYGNNDSNGDDLHPCEMVIEAVNLADDAGIDFSKYDWDGDGEVEQVLVIYAGTGENHTYNDSDVWPHEWTLDDGMEYNDGTGAQYIDGVFINTYCVTCELSSATTMEGIGTACHEFSHSLGLPDTYDTNNSGGHGMGSWSVMCSGNYNGPGYSSDCPAGYTAFERWTMGWLEPVELSENAIGNNLPALDNSPSAYVIYNDGNRNEFFMLENRQPVKWDKYISSDSRAHGMLITHIDYDEEIWKENTINTEINHQRMIYVPANNSYFSENGNTFPGTSRKTAFANTTSPAAKLYNPNIDGSKLLNKPVTSITESGGIISFDFFNDNIKPQLLLPADITADSFTAKWQSIGNAQSYTLWLTPHKEHGALLLSEDFGKFTESINTNIADNINLYTTTSGWCGQKIFCDDGTVKLGSSKEDGFIVTAPVTSESGVFTVYFEAKRYNTDSRTMVVWLSSPSSPELLLKADGTHYVKDITMNDDMTPYALTFSCSDKCSVRFDPEKRAYLDNIRIYEGSLTLDDIAALSNSAEDNNDGSITISGISGTQYTCTGLTKQQYNYRVKAITQYGETPWSDQNSVKLDVTSANSLRQDATNTPVRIYNLLGQYVGSDISRLAAGIYVIGGRKYMIR